MSENSVILYQFVFLRDVKDYNNLQKRYNLFPLNQDHIFFEKRQQSCMAACVGHSLTFCFLYFFISSSSSSVGAATLGGFWPALRFCSTIFYLYTSLSVSSFSLSYSLDPLLLGQAISFLVFLLVLMNMVPIQ